MTAQLLSSELANLIQEAKRKNTELRNAAEQSLNDLKALPITSEAQLAADLNRRPNFVRPFLLACGTRNTKYAGNAIVCLQRLVVSNGLPKETLKEVLEAFRECSSLGLDIQLKILQALPSLLQNYAGSLTGELLGATLQVCCLLHGSKTAVVSNTAAATLQQLVVAVLDNVVAEDSRSGDLATVAEVQIGNGGIAVRTAALDAYRFLNDLCLLTEGRKAEFLQTAPLPQNFGLELLESILTNHVETVLSHPEQIHVLRVRLVPFIIKLLSERLTFATTVRAMRLLHLIFKRMLTALAPECEMALSLFNHMLDPEAAVTWKRALCLEIWRSIHSEPALVRSLYSLYDEQDGKRDILQDHMSGLVRLAVEKPTVIGISQQSTVPAFTSESEDNSGEQAAMQAGGVAGIIGAPVGMTEHNVHGISVRWSTIRVSCLDQLDKSDAPNLPATYIYGLTLTCINSFSEGLARFLLPLNMSNEAKGQRKQRVTPDVEKKKDLPPLDADSSEAQLSRANLSRHQSSRGPRLPVNPLDLDRHPLYSQICTSAHIVDSCWPALLATSSTFLNAALDSDFYHALVRSFQKFTQVAGILCLFTPRDAFLTTLGKHAVPSAFGAAHAIGSPMIDGRSLAGRMSENSSGEDLASPMTGAPSERGRQSMDLSITTLNTRNLLCLRALLNLGIALGPTLESAWSIILETLMQADIIITISTRSNHHQAGYNPKLTGQDPAEDPSIQGNLAAEINAVYTAAYRMFESTSDLSDEAFLDALQSLCGLIRHAQNPTPEQSENSAGDNHATRAVSHTHRRIFSSTGLSTGGNVTTVANSFVLDKLGDMVRQNIDRLQRNEKAETGWKIITETLIEVLSSSNMGNDIRMKAAQILNSLIIAVSTSPTPASPTELDEVRRRALTCLRSGIDALYSREAVNPKVSSQGCELEIHHLSLRALASILEQCGDSIGAGWDIVFTIVSSVFVEHGSEENTDNLQTHSAPVSRSSKLVRSSFASLQLICSDFITYLPQSCFPTLLDTLYSFCSQEEDFNISLTTTTFFWNVSDFLQGNIQSFHLDGPIHHARTEIELATLANNQDPQTSSAALWLCLLLRLKAMTTDPRLEVRHGAIHTTFRIFDACGDQLSSRAWRTCLGLIILDMLYANEMRYQSVKSSSPPNQDISRTDWNETAIVLIGAVARLFEQFSETIIAMNNFQEPWQALLQCFLRFLDRGSLDLDASCFATLTAILSKIDNIERVGDRSIDIAWNLWVNNSPPIEESPPGNGDNQPALMAYLQCLREIYRLIDRTLQVEQVKMILGLLRLCVTGSNVTNYCSDLDALTTLQTDVLKCVKMIRTDLPGVPSETIQILAFFVALAYEDHPEVSNRRRPTYVALSKTAMDVLGNFIMTHRGNQSIYASGAVNQALIAYAVPIKLKYRWSLEGKGPPTWRKATDSARSVLEMCIPVIRKIHSDQFDVSVFWEKVVQLVDGIVDANCDLCPTSSNIYDDQDFDAQAFIKIRDMITPALGSANIHDRVRRKYAESLFYKSIIHVPHPDDLPRPGQEPLENLRSTHIGRVQRLPPSPRAKLSYILLDELFNLVAVAGSSPERVKLAQAAAPFLILRAGITLKAYILDQPLRGLRPQPLTQRRELLYLLKKLAELESEPKAIPDAPGVVSALKKHLHRLYPLVTRALGVAARDEGVLAAVERVLEVVGEGFGL